jgi:glucokinase-like ROK family protein
LTDFVANVLWRDRVYFYPTQDTESVFERARQLIERAMELGHLKRLRHLGIGVGVPGLVDIKEGLLIFAPNLGWRNISFPELWEKRFGVNVFVENESNAAALGEFYFGAGRGIGNQIYLSAGIGLGAGIILRGRLFRGTKGFAGEVGHMTVDPNGEQCGCGKRGCWETTAGTRAIVRRVCKAIAGNGESRIASLCGNNPDLIDIDMVIAAAQVGDPTALECLHQTGEQLGIGIANLINTFNPEMVVIGGMLSEAGTFLLPTVRAAVDEHALPRLREGVRVVLSAHGTDACVLGAVALVLDDILKEPTL